MAKRKRLAPAKMDPAAGQGDAVPLETKSARLSPQPAPPIAHVTSDAATTAALEELSDTLRRARAEGRMIIDVPLAQIAEDYLVRDRVAISGEDMTALEESIKARGQQTPIELVDLGQGGYGLISGWRRMQALRALGSETAKAIVTPPRDAQDAYVAMIEENEIRVGLSYFERARIVLKSVEAGVHDSHKTALQSLFSSASRAKRSKIKSFIPVVEALGDVLRFPTELGERLGLQLSKVIEGTQDSATRLQAELKRARPDSVEAERQVLEKTLNSLSGSKNTKKPPHSKPALGRNITPVPGISITTSSGSLTLEGQGVTPQLYNDLLVWLKGRT